MNLRPLKSLLATRHPDRGLERYRRAGITASTSFLSKALTIVIGVVSVPLTVHYLGAERYGVWLTISSLLTWLALTDFGIAGNALVNVIAEANGRDDRQTAREYTASAFWALLAVSATIGLLLALGFHAIPWRTVFRVSSDVSNEELNFACGLTLCVFVVNLPLTMLNSIYGAYQDGFVSDAWSMASNVLALAGLIVVSRFRGGLPALIVLTFASRALVGILNAIYLFAFRYPWLRPAPAAVHWTHINRLFSLGGQYMVAQLASLGIYQSQPFMITQLLGPSQVVIFVVAYKIIALPVDLAYLATAPFVSACAEAKARGDWKWISGAYRNASLACIAVGIPITFGIAFAAKILARLLAGPQAVPDWSVVVWLAAYTLVGSSLMMAGQVLSGLERVGTLAISLSLAAIGTIVLGIFFGRAWGLAGVAAAMAISKAAAFLPLQTYQVRRVLRTASSSLPQSQI